MEATTNLRFVKRGYTGRLILQQAWIVREIVDPSATTVFALAEPAHGQIEWRDVPLVEEM